MSFLAPLFLVGGLAVSLPVLLHLIRRTPRGRQPFSSLLFLTASPPRITRRSRIEHWLLLLLRAAAVLLLAAAFARPFLRESASQLLDPGPGRQVALLIDTSASMRRAGLWAQATNRARRVLDGLGPNDLVALFQFDSQVHTVVNFPEPASLDSRTQRELIKSELQQLSPTWRATNLGRALATVADSLTAARRGQSTDLHGQIVLISDFQQGADLSALQGYEWPKDVLVTAETVRPTRPGNASLRLLTDSAESNLRARIANSIESKVEQFRLGWVSTNGDLIGSSDVYVPAGQTRVVKLDERPAGADRLRLRGDDQDFDNDFFTTPFAQQQFSVVYLGDDAADNPRGLRYFLDRVWDETVRRKVSIVDRKSQDVLEFPPASAPKLPASLPNQPASVPSLPANVPHLIVSAGVSPSHRAALQQFLESGGKVLFVAVDTAAAEALTQFLPGVAMATGSPDPPRPTTTVDGNKRSYALLRDIDFEHPLLSAFSDPRFGDFTKVRFWNHQYVRPESNANARVLIRFDNELPALWLQPVGAGQAFVMTSSWRPEDSQLALSSKFVPLMSSLLNYSAGIEPGFAPSRSIGEPISLTVPAGEQVTVTTPDGTVQPLSMGVSEFAGTDAPGTYHFQMGPSRESYAVNLPPNESDTAPVAADQLDQLRVRTGAVPDHQAQLDRQRQLRDIELESRQKLWQWLIAAAIGVLGVETLVASWLQASARTERAASLSPEGVGG